MDLFLRIQIFHQLSPVVQPNRKSKELPLPPELLKLRTLRLDPLLRLQLHLRYNPLYPLHLAQVKRSMNVIGKHRAPHKHVVAPRQRPMQTLMHPLPHLRRRQPRTPLLRAPHRMHQHTTQFHAPEYKGQLHERP